MDNHLPPRFRIPRVSEPSSFQCTRNSSEPRPSQVGPCQTEPPSSEGYVRLIRSYMNKLTPDNIERVAQIVIGRLTYTLSEENVWDLADVIFESAVQDVNYSRFFAGFCSRLMDSKLRISGGGSISFHNLFLELCRREFEEGRFISVSIADYEDAVGQRGESIDLLRAKVKRRYLGNLRLIGELFRLDRLAQPIVETCFHRLIEMAEKDFDNRAFVIDCLSTLWPYICTKWANDRFTLYFDRFVAVVGMLGSKRASWKITSFLERSMNQDVALKTRFEVRAEARRDELRLSSVERVERETKRILETYIATEELSMTTRSVKALIRREQNAVPTLSRTIVLHTLDRTPWIRHRAGLLLARMFYLGLLDPKALLLALRHPLNDADALFVDTPRLWDNLAQILSPLVNQHRFPLHHFADLCKVIFPESHVGMFLAGVLIEVERQLGASLLLKYWETVEVADAFGDILWNEKYFIVECFRNNGLRNLLVTFRFFNNDGFLQQHQRKELPTADLPLGFESTSLFSHRPSLAQLFRDSTAISDEASKTDYGSLMADWLPPLAAPKLASVAVERRKFWSRKLEDPESPLVPPTFPEKHWPKQFWEVGYSVKYPCWAPISYPNRILLTAYCNVNASAEADYEPFCPWAPQSDLLYRYLFEEKASGEIPEASCADHFSFFSESDGFSTPFRYVTPNPPIIYSSVDKKNFVNPRRQPMSIRRDRAPRDVMESMNYLVKQSQPPGAPVNDANWEFGSGCDRFGDDFRNIWEKESTVCSSDITDPWPANGSPDHSLVSDRRSGKEDEGCEIAEQLESVLSNWLSSNQDPTDSDRDDDGSSLCSDAKVSRDPGEGVFAHEGRRTTPYFRGLSDFSNYSTVRRESQHSTSTSLSHASFDLHMEDWPSLQPSQQLSPRHSIRSVGDG